MTTLSETRSAILARLVTRAPDKKLGRTQLMKLVYFLQELRGVPLGYDFRLFAYGPFDSEVLGDLATATNVGLLSEKTVIYPRGYGYEITPGRHADRLGQELEANDPTIATQVDAVVGEFSHFGAAELELRSTIVFVDRELPESASLSATALAERVREIKPYFTSEAILERVKDMQRRGWLRRLTPSLNVPIPI